MTGTNAEVLPGAAAQEVDHIMMQDVVGDYDAPDTVPEWQWVERNACFAHVRNGQDGIWEFVINMAMSMRDVPAKLAPVLDRARQAGTAYLIFHQGT